MDLRQLRPPQPCPLAQIARDLRGRRPSEAPAAGGRRASCTWWVRADDFDVPAEVGLISIGSYPLASSTAIQYTPTGGELVLRVEAKREAMGGGGGGCCNTATAVLASPRRINGRIFRSFLSQ